ncbi:hypothetical protein [Streptomyces calidiresistens]|uniref:hypothetical protein n=1 Tax=Streptomyces calidiresistens TaxID=1485586 RepID=UPI002B1F7F39|nr:hypothetical protein [Streptomyces calidiresistens]
MALLLLILLGVVATPWLMVYSIKLLTRAGVNRTAVAFLKSGAVLTWTATVGMYTWGVLRLFFFDSPDQSRACNEVLGTQRLAGYAPSFFPLRFGCLTGDGRTIEAGVIPSYINPAVAVLAVCAVALTVFAVAQRKEVEK